MFRPPCTGKTYSRTNHLKVSQKVIAMVSSRHIHDVAKKAFSVGKPSPVMMRAARKELGLEAADTTMIGDTMDTDILGGVQMGYRTILVLSGSTSRDDLKDFAYRPDLVVDSIADLLDPSPAIRRFLNDVLPAESMLAG